MRYSAILIACLAASASAFAQERKSPASTVEYDSVAGAAASSASGEQLLPYQHDSSERMTVHVRVGESGPYNFLIDTGADRTVVSSDVAGRLKLAGRDSATLHSVTGRQQVRTAAIARLHFSNKTMHNVHAAVLDDRNIGADGILGIDSLRSERVTFDFKKKQMTIVPSVVRPERVNGDEIVVRGKLRAGRLVLTQATAGGRRMSVVVDTGADVSIGNGALYQSLRRTGLLKPLGTVQMQSVTGELLTGDLMVLDKFELAGISIRDLHLVFADAHTFKTLKLQDKPALLMGMNTLKAFERVSIDFANRRFRVVMPEEALLRTFHLAAR